MSRWHIWIWKKTSYGEFGKVTNVRLQCLDFSLNLLCWRGNEQCIFAEISVTRHFTSPELILIYSGVVEPLPRGSYAISVRAVYCFEVHVGFNGGEIYLQIITLHIGIYHSQDRRRIIPGECRSTLYTNSQRKFIQMLCYFYGPKFRWIFVWPRLNFRRNVSPVYWQCQSPNMWNWR